MRKSRVLSILSGAVMLPFFLAVASAAEREPDVFSSFEQKEMFAREVSGLIGRAWKEWQDSMVIGVIKVEGSSGILSPGDLAEPALKRSFILKGFDPSGKSYEYTECLKTVVDAVSNSMRKWQRGYSNNSIPFPQGAACNFTLPECNNLPVPVSSGISAGDKSMSEEALYSYMKYHSLVHSIDTDIVYRASAKGIASCFDRWRVECSIVGILASGGIAPSPEPMGGGMGPVRGAKGKDGKLEGRYFCQGEMYKTMMDYFKSAGEGHDVR